MKPGLTFSKQLLQLLDGDQINQSMFQGTSRKLLELFITDGVLDFNIAGSQRKKVFCPNAAGLRNYLNNKHGITSLEEYVAFHEKEDADRSEAVRVASNSKARQGKHFQGFLINTLLPIKGYLKEEEISLNPQDGSYLFIHDFLNFSIPQDVMVVIVENYQNFRDLNRQQHLFTHIKPIFLWRYQNMNLIVEWLRTNKNPCLYFGDFDLAGIKIYITEFRNKLHAGRCQFFYPDNLESLLIKYGSRSLYEKQWEFVKNIDFSLYPEIQTPLHLMKQHKKGLEQEILIEDFLPRN